MTTTKEMIDRAVLTIEKSGLIADVKCSKFYEKGENQNSLFDGKGITLSINIKGGVRPVSVWPIQGTVFAGKVKNKKGIKGIKWPKSVSIKKQSFDGSVYIAVQTALTGGE